MDVESNIGILEKFIWMEYWGFWRKIRTHLVEDGNLDQTWGISTIIKLLRLPVYLYGDAFSFCPLCICVQFGLYRQQMLTLLS